MSECCDESKTPASKVPLPPTLKATGHIGPLPPAAKPHYRTVDPAVHAMLMAGPKELDGSTFVAGYQKKNS